MNDLTVHRIPHRVYLCTDTTTYALATWISPESTRPPGTPLHTSAHTPKDRPVDPASAAHDRHASTQTSLSLLCSLPLILPFHISSIPSPLTIRIHPSIHHYPYTTIPSTCQTHLSTALIRLSDILRGVTHTRYNGISALGRAIRMACPPYCGPYGTSPAPSMNPSTKSRSRSRHSKLAVSPNHYLIAAWHPFALSSHTCTLMVSISTSFLILAALFHAPCGAA
jgi:hypothetical protein